VVLGCPACRKRFQTSEALWTGLMAVITLLGQAFGGGRDGRGPTAYTGPSSPQPTVGYGDIRPIRKKARVVAVLIAPRVFAVSVFGTPRCNFGRFGVAVRE
jgi:hypothetical protein